MPTVQDIIDYIRHLAGRPPGSDEGVQHGSADAEVRGVTLSWMATPSALRAAGEAGHDLLISHESLYFPYGVTDSDQQPNGWKSWPVNRQRRELLECYGLAFARLHGTLDQLCVCDEFGTVLGLGQTVERDGLALVYEPDDCTLRELIYRVKGALEMPAVRVAAAHGWDHAVSRVGLAVGGLGLFVNVGSLQKLVEMDCDVVIAGESDDYGLRFAVESGASLIETSHELSENPGLRHTRDILAEQFPEVSFRFHENLCPWEVV